MIRALKRSLFSFVLVATLSFAYRDSERTFDFDFRDMELRVAVQSVAKLMNRYVIFQNAASGVLPVTLELTDVTPGFALQMLLESNGLFANEKGGIYFIQPLADRKPSAMTPVVIPLVNVTAKDIESNVKGFLGKDLTYTINEQKNAFIVAGPEEMISSLKQLIAELDQEVSQIHIEARIVEVSRDFSRVFGIEWSKSPGSIDKLVDPQVINVNSTDGLKGGFRVGFLGNNSPLDLQIRTLERNGHAKMLSSPKITTLNGTAATISNNTTLSFLSQASTTTAGTTSQGTAKTDIISAALNFTVTPIIVSDDQVRLNIEMLKSDPGVKIDGVSATVSSNSIKTSFMVRTGQTAGIAGLTSRYNSDNSSGVPFLSAIPIIGALFGSVSKEEKERDLLIFMTPQIYKGTNQNLRRRPSETEMGPEEIQDAEDALNNLHGSTITVPPELPEAVASKDSLGNTDGVGPSVVEGTNARTEDPKPGSAAEVSVAPEKTSALPPALPVDPTKTTP